MERILFLVNHEIVIYNFRKELVEQLLKDGNEVIISSPYGEKIEILKNMGCEFAETKIDRHGKNPLEDIILFFTYLKLIKKYKPTIILTYTIKPTIYGALAAGFYKIPCYVNVTGLGIAVENPGFTQKLIKVMYKISLKKVRCIFFQNETNMEFFLKNKLTSAKRVLLPGSGVNINEFTYSEYPQYPQYGDKFLFAGRVMKDKGIDEYLYAAQKVKEKYPNAEFHITGFLDGDYEAKITDYEMRGIIKYHGHQMDMKPFYKRCCAVVLPSYHEGMANVLLEAAAMGRPVLASDIPGCRETFNEGETGFAFRVMDNEDLLKKIFEFMEIPESIKAVMGRNARAKIVEQFNRQIVIDAYLNEIYGRYDNY